MDGPQAVFAVDNTVTELSPVVEQPKTADDSLWPRRHDRLNLVDVVA